jgi:photosystem II stability/assembly factor-like uncharacterized protein
MKFILIIPLFTLLSSCHGRTSNAIEINTHKTTTSDTLKSDKSINENNGIIYFSFDNGNTWEDKSNGLPEHITLTDIAVSNELIGAATKQHGIFLYNFKERSWANTAYSPQTTSNLDAIIFHNNRLLVGTEKAGVFISADKGKTWLSLNEGLGNLTIRKFAVIDHKLYVGTNGGLYSLNEKAQKWTSEYGQNSLQVNGITEFDGEIYIGANQGIFKSLIEKKDWKQIMKDFSLHNISSDDRRVYAMTYNELFASVDKGTTWQSIQKGLPAQLYSFQLLKKDSTIFVGQWDGVYKKQTVTGWTNSSAGLPSKFAVTEMKIYQNIIVIGCSERKLKKGMTTDK